MRFGFDVDDTLINLREHAFHLYNKKLNKQLGLDIFQKIKRVEIHEPFGLTDREGADMWKSSLEEIYFTSCPAYPGAVEILNKLVAEGHEVFYITARPKEHCERTKEWLVERGFPVEDARFFCGMKDLEKVDIIQRLGLDFYFDDKPEILDSLKALPVRLYVKDQAYNQHSEAPRITDWTEWKY